LQVFVLLFAEDQDLPEHLLHDNRCQTYSNDGECVANHFKIIKPI
jgi:hypothetical protein